MLTKPTNFYSWLGTMINNEFLYLGCNNNDQKISKGFSLVELVIVIAILTIFSALAIPSFLGTREKAADTLVKVSMLNSLKECKLGIVLEEEVATFTADLGLNSTNGFYQFYQQYDYIPREDGYIPPTIIGNCIGPLGAHRIGVKKIKGINAGGELWLNLSTGEKIESGGLSWD